MTILHSLMTTRRRLHINIVLILATLTLGGWVWLIHRVPVVADSGAQPSDHSVRSDTSILVAGEPAGKPIELSPDSQQSAQLTKWSDSPSHEATTSFRELDTHTVSANHPFRHEVRKVLSGHLEESDSISRHKILSYCEHLRTAYTSRDIDFIRQVYSDDALIIVGHMVKSDASRASGMNLSPRVSYSIRTKKEYVDRLARIFRSAQSIDVAFSDFKILRHPTMPGIYGVTLRQKYTSGSYSDDGYLFLLWDFRDPSMPLIHVRTWQPSQSLASADDIIDISDFNLE